MLHFFSLKVLESKSVHKSYIFGAFKPILASTIFGPSFHKNDLFFPTKLACTISITVWYNKNFNLPVKLSFIKTVLSFLFILIKFSKHFDNIMEHDVYSA